MITTLTPHGYQMLPGWCDDVSEQEVRRREAAAALRAVQGYRRPCEFALRMVRPVDIPDRVEVERWRVWDQQEGGR